MSGSAAALTRSSTRAIGRARDIGPCGCASIENVFFFIITKHARVFKMRDVDKNKYINKAHRIQYLFLVI